MILCRTELVLLGSLDLWRLRQHTEKLATPVGFEPTTTGLEGRCSIQLSYGVSLLV